MAKASAGILLFRKSPQFQVFLVHPGGPFFKNKDLGSWSIPKGEIESDENPQTAAQREFKEETGIEPKGNLIHLTPIRQKSGKLVHAWAVEGDADPEAIVSNEFEMQWPPRSNRMARFPEIDRAAWFDISQARTKIIAAQVALVNELEALIAGNKQA